MISLPNFFQIFPNISPTHLHTLSSCLPLENKQVKKKQTN